MTVVSLVAKSIGWFLSEEENTGNAGGEGMKRGNGQGRERRPLAMSPEPLVLKSGLVAHTLPKGKDSMGWNK